MATRKKLKAKAIKKHTAKATLQVQSLSKAGSTLNLEIRAHEKRIGTLEIGQGGLFWRGAKRQISKRLSWTRFAEMMDDLAYGQ